MLKNKEESIILTRNFNPLVSIVVVTYNSANFVRETLESAKDQSYKNIELIVTDDSSTDNTLEVCRTWIENNKDEFVRIRLLISDKNTGVPGNCNRGVKESKGEWIKFIAGDDALCKDAIKYMVEFTNMNKEVSVFASNVAIYENMLDEKYLSSIRNNSLSDFYKAPASNQFSRLLYKNEITAVGVFFKRSLIIEVDGFDERFKYIEDHPIMLNVTKRGIKIFYMNKLTAKYRIHNASITKSIFNKKKIFGDFYLKQREFQKICIYPYINWFGKFTLNYEFYRHYWVDKLKLNQNNIYGRSIHFLMRKVSPINLKINWIKK